MSSSLVALYQRDLAPANTDDGPFATLLSREAALAQLSEPRAFDLVVIGGGCMGALAARDAALHGLRVLILETGFFGERSERWRDSFLRALRQPAPAIVRAAFALKAVSRTLLGDLDQRTPQDSGLTVGAGGNFRLWLLRKIWSGSLARGNQRGVPDVDELLLNRELVLAARQEGALALSMAEPSYVERDTDDGGYRVGVKDLLAGENQEVKAACVFVDPTCSVPLASRLGTQLVAARSPDSPTVVSVCAVIPTNVLSGEPLISLELSDGSVAVISKIAEGVVEITLHFVAAIPAELNLTSLIMEACREAGWTLRDEMSRVKTGRRFASRAGLGERKGLFVAFESRPWDLQNVASKGLSKILSHIGWDGNRLKGRLERTLPGAERACEISAFRALARTAGVSEHTIELVVQRWRGRVRYLDCFDNGLEEVCPGVLRGEIALAIASDQVATLDDLVFGSLRLHYLPQWMQRVPLLARELEKTGRFSERALAIERVVTRGAPPTTV